MITTELKRILIADDDLELRSMMGLILSDEGYHISQATTGMEAITMHRRNPFDLVIIELGLDGKDGFQTLAELRHSPSPAKFMAVAKSNWIPAEHSLRMAERLGAHGVLAKPFKSETLLAVVRKVLCE
jgi:DNA-binding response OmpR family regulator